MDTGEDVAIKLGTSRAATAFDKEAISTKNSLEDAVFPPSACMAGK
jgi:hypothetical protein